MSNPNQPEPKSLKDKIHKRKTQEIARQMEANKRPSQTMRDLPRKTELLPPPDPSPDSSAQPKQTDPHLPLTPRQLLSFSPHVSDEITRIRQILTAESLQAQLRSRPFQIAIFAGLLIILVSLATVFAARDVSQVLPTPIQLPAVRSLEAVNYLKRAGLSIDGIRPFSAPNSTWQAQEEIQFAAHLGAGNGTFIILSYSSLRQAGADAYLMPSTERFKGWHYVAISNLLVLAAPGSDKALYDDMVNDLAQYLVAPYVAFIPTTTLQVPSSTPGELPPPATQIPTTPASISPSSAAAEGGSSLAVTDSSAQTPTNTPVPTVTNTSGATNTPTYTPLPPSLVTASGRLVPPGETSTGLYTKHAPQTVGPFTLQGDTSHSDRFSATMLYQSNSGEQFRVVVLVMLSPQDSLTRYNGDISFLPNAQQIPVGEQGVMGSPESPILAETRFRNVVIVVYRLRQMTSVKVVPPQQQEVIDLLKALYDVVP